MCLLDRVVSWDEQGVRCTASSHRSPGNPLRENVGPDRLGGELPVWAGVEYAAQAAAVHGSLAHASTGPRQGVLAAARNVVAACDRLDEFPGDLAIGAVVKHSDPAGAIYSFEVHAGERLLLSGQFTLMFIADRGGAP